MPPRQHRRLLPAAGSNRWISFEIEGGYPSFDQEKRSMRAAPSSFRPEARSFDPGECSFDPPSSSLSVISRAWPADFSDPKSRVGRDLVDAPDPASIDPNPLHRAGIEGVPPGHPKTPSPVERRDTLAGSADHRPSQISRPAFCFPRPQPDHQPWHRTCAAGKRNLPDRPSRFPALPLSCVVRPTLTPADAVAALSPNDRWGAIS